MLPRGAGRRGGKRHHYFFIQNRSKMASIDFLPVPDVFFRPAAPDDLPQIAKLEVRKGKEGKQLATTILMTTMVVDCRSPPTPQTKPRVGTV